MRLITFGEIMMRLSTPPKATFDKNDTFDINIGGSEMNVAMGLASSGIDVSMITALPDNAFGKRVTQLLKQHDIHTGNIQYTGERIGINFMELGFGVRSTSVVYDRKYSSFNQSGLDDYDFENMFKGYDWFHFSGITPALTKELQEALKKALEAAVAAGMKISADLNFRGNLWSFEEAREAISPLIKYCDVIFGYEPLSLVRNGQDIKDGLERNPSVETLQPILKEIHEEYEVETIAFTQREVIHSNKNIIKGMISHDGKIIETPQYEIDILDRIGSGDAFTAGVLYGIFKQISMEETLHTALGNMLYKHTVTGDYSVENIEHMADILDGNKEVKR